MRYIADITNNTQTKRLMICNKEHEYGAYLFLFDKVEDCHCYADSLFDNIDGAFSDALEGFGISRDNWDEIGDSAVGCFDDRLENVKMKSKIT